ncbi:MAG TPA: hypothetical protein VKT75_19165, partial [Acidobacteriaceae bacterium]|nr:hypothetical protein [Acidobacteriaceae bacterium]
PYSLLVGHLVGVGAGFLSLWGTRAWWVPPVSGAGVPLSRVACLVLAAALTVFLNLLIQASQPAATATALLIAAGLLQRPVDAAVMMGAVLLMALVGEPLRRLRLSNPVLKQEEQNEK